MTNSKGLSCVKCRHAKTCFVRGFCHHSEPGEHGVYCGHVCTIWEPQPAYSDPAERELQTELRNQGIMNAPEPVCCPQCRGELETSRGMVGEKVLVCAVHGLVWEDHEDAIRRVI